MNREGKDQRPQSSFLLIRCACSHLFYKFPCVIRKTLGSAKTKFQMPPRPWIAQSHDGEILGEAHSLSCLVGDGCHSRALVDQSADRVKIPHSDPPMDPSIAQFRGRSSISTSTWGCATRIRTVPLRPTANSANSRRMRSFCSNMALAYRAKAVPAGVGRRPRTSRNARAFEYVRKKPQICKSNRIADIFTFRRPFTHGI